MLDKQTMTYYNAVFRFLLRIKRVNYVIQHRDFWVRMHIPRNIAEDTPLQEQIAYKKKAELNSLMHQM